MDAPRRERKKQAVRETLLAEARRLFVARGIEGTAVTDITEAADVAAGTFFNHFSGKDELVAELAAGVFEPLVRALEPATPDDRVAARAADFFGEASRTLAGARAHLGELLVALVRASAACDAPIDPLAGLRRAWSRLLFDGQRRGEVRADAEAAYLAELVVGAFAAALLHWLRDPRYPLERRMAQLADFVAGALGTSPAAPAPALQPSDEERAA
jgi:AcrR family transcriptional regulator